MESHHHHHHHLHRKKRPRNLKLHIPISPSPSNLLLLFLIISLFLLFLIFLTRFPSGSHSFRPILTISRAHPLSIQDSSPLSLPPLKIEHQISFPDHVLLLVSKIGDQSLMNSYRIALECVHRFVDDSTRSVVLPVLSVEDYDGWRSIVRCPVSSDSSKKGKSPVFVALRQRGGSSGEEEEGEEDGLFRRREWMHSWEDLVYNGVIDGETAVVFVKGLNLRRDRASDAAQFKCHFGWGNKFNALTTSAVTAAQEIVRCSLPRSFRNLPEKADGVGITISTVAHHGGEGEGEGEGEGLVHYVPSVARLSNLIDKRRKHELCVCTMLWNQASSLKEWIQYHAWLGVERWFIYDNNSDDGIKEVVEQLEQENYNVSRHTWPWIKTQEAGFSHCALRAKSECKWVGFIDVDEFFYFPIPLAPNRKTGEFGVYPGRNSLQSLVANVSHLPAAAGIGEIRTSCHSFGPSGLNKHPSQGVTLGYTCRLQSPERHKSIVLLDALDETLLTVVHHFHLKKGFTYINLPESTALINHYKYQVWEKFKAKFSRRVATYVADWQENQNEGSKDRAPGLGTEAIEPPNWSRQFCEVWDTGLRDFLIANLADPSSGLLPWEGHDSQ